jgi:hypothetical protein
MEVELSNAESTLRSNASTHTRHPSPYDPNPKTPQRASEVFRFLTDKKRRPQERPLPGLPPSPGIDSGDTVHHDNDQGDSKIPIQRDTHLYRSQSSRPPLDDGMGYEQVGLSVIRAKSYCGLPREGPNENQAIHESSMLRGPRPYPTSLFPPKSTLEYPYCSETPTIARDHRRSKSGSPHDDRFTRIPSRTLQLRKASSSLSLASTPVKFEEGGYPQAVPPKEKTIRMLNKENEYSDSRTSVPYMQHIRNNTLALPTGFLAAYHPLPKTPMRTNAHAHSRAVFFSPPSPASSTELSPVAKQMMKILREKRSKARLAERTRGKLTGRFVRLKP